MILTRPDLDHRVGEWLAGSHIHEANIKNELETAVHTVCVNTELRESFSIYPLLPICDIRRSKLHAQNTADQWGKPKYDERPTIPGT